MAAFDQPEPLLSQGNRPATTVAPQALLLMNAPSIREWAESFARRVQHEAAGPELADWVDRAFRLALGRAPSVDESKAAIDFLLLSIEVEPSMNPSAPDIDVRPPPALVDFCQVLFGLNEFVYPN
jgi:hypothetical protein